MGSRYRPGFTTPPDSSADAMPSKFRSLRSRIMYIENKSGGLEGAARIGRVYFSKTGSTLYYRGSRFRSLKGAGFKSNYFEVESGDEYWISGPRKDTNDRLYGGSRGVEIDPDVLAEYTARVTEKKPVKSKQSGKLVDGAFCKVVGGTHMGKCGTVRDINTSKLGHITITVVQENGVRFKTLARNVEVEGKK